MLKCLWIEKPIRADVLVYLVIFVSSINPIVGFVSYDSPEAAQVAISQMDGFNVNGKRLKVQLKTASRSTGRPY